MNRIDLLEEHAREKAGQPAEWHVYRMEAGPASAKEPFYYELSGAVAPQKKRGTGYNWRKLDKATDVTIHFLITEHYVWVKKWEQRTGKCANCVGTGEVFAQWNKETGVRYVPCMVCFGTGLNAGQGVRNADEP